jgi:hypothetical protein
MNDYFEFEGINDELFLNKKENYSNFAVDPLTAGLEAVGKGLEMGGKIAEASAKKKEASAKITEIAGKRQAQLTACEKAKENRFALDPKKTKNKIKDCKDEVKKRLDSEENEQKDIVRRMTAIEENKLTSDLEKEKSNIDEKKSSKKLYVFGGIVGLVLVLGTIVYLNKKG